MMEQHQLLTAATANHFIAGGGFATIIAARKFAAEVLQQPVETGTLIAKMVEEAIEAGMVRAARSIIADRSTTGEAFDCLVELYGRQPNLRTRSSTSIRQQAYSTPLPVAYLAGVLADIQPHLTVYEPTAGHGALLLDATPDQAIVNELNLERAGDLRQQGYQVNTEDATSYLPLGLVDRVIMNPPFGSITQGEKKQQWQVRGNVSTKPYKTTRIDHVIALRGLSVMKDGGKAALIMGAPLANRRGDTESSASTYNGQEMRAFYYSLYHSYNVIDHFLIAGNIYGKQGTSFPIDIVIIDGRGRSSRRLPAAELPPVYTNFEQLKELLPNVARTIR